MPGTPLDLLAGFHRAMLALAADAFAELHAPDAVYEFPLATPGRPERYDGREEIRAGFSEVWAEAARAIRVIEIRGVVVHHTVDPEVIVVEHAPVVESLDTGERALAPSLVVLRAHGGALTHVRDYSAGTRRPLAD